MNNRLQTLITALLGLWLLVSFFVISQVDTGPETPYLAYALLLFTVVFSLAAPFRYAGYVAGILSIAVYAGVLYLLRPIGQSLLLPALLGAIAFLGTGLLAVGINQQTEQLQRDLENDRKIIEKLQLHDPDTRLMRLSYARQALRSEIRRSERYQSIFCLLLIKLVGYEEHESGHLPGSMSAIRREVGRIMNAILRVTDMPFSNGNFGIICPETSTEQAAIVARRLVSEITRQVRLGTHVGIAEFGIDASNEEEIFRAAEAALNMAITTEEAVVWYSRLQNGPDLK